MKVSPNQAVKIMNTSLIAGWQEVPKAKAVFIFLACVYTTQELSVAVEEIRLLLGSW